MLNQLSLDAVRCGCPCFYQTAKRSKHSYQSSSADSDHQFPSATQVILRIRRLNVPKRIPGTRVARVAEPPCAICPILQFICTGHSPISRLRPAAGHYSPVDPLLMYACALTSCHPVFCEQPPSLGPYCLLDDPIHSHVSLAVAFASRG